MHVGLRLLCISMPSAAKQQREMTKFKDGGFFMFFSYLNAVSINLVPAHFAHNVQVERSGRISSSSFAKPNPLTPFVYLRVECWQ